MTAAVPHVTATEVAAVEPECWCPDSFRSNAVRVDYCPAHGTSCKCPPTKEGYRLTCGRAIPETECGNRRGGEPR